MPTTKPRHAITETDKVAAALAVAAQRWPADRDHPSRLLAHLIEAGVDSITPEVEQKIERRRDVLRGLAGSMTGVYEPGYLHDLREDWSE